MKLLNKLTIKKCLWGFIFLAILVIGYDYYQSSQPNIWGDEPDEPYITITGKKPDDAYLESWAHFWVTGDECEAYSYDLFGRKAHQGGKISQKITHNFAKDNSNYEFRIPYQPYMTSQKCIVELRDFSIQAYNKFDTVGFAQLRISPAGNEYYNKPIDLDSLIEAKDCRTIYYEDLKEWSTALACSFFTNGKMRNKRDDLVEFNAYTVYYDFSQFNNNTVIHYDILAGEHYRTEPLDQEKGPQ